MIYYVSSVAAINTTCYEKFFITSNKTLYPLNYNSPFLPFQTTGNLYSTCSHYEFAYFIDLFFWPCLWHVEVPRLGIKPEPQQQSEVLQ